MCNDLKPPITCVKTINLMMWLAARDLLFFSEYDDEDMDWEGEEVGFSCAILCNDTFYYASADAESICDVEDLELVKYLYEKYSYDGVVAWVSSQRNWQEPLKPLQTDKYYEAVKFIQDMHDWAKIDRCPHCYTELNGNFDCPECTL